MNNARSVRIQVAVGFALPAVVLLLFGALSYRAITRFTQARAWVAHSNELRVEIGALLNTLVEAESGQRGFVLTTGEAFLQPYRVALALLDKRYERLQHMTADNPQQQQRLKVLRTRLDAKLHYMQRSIDARRLTGEARMLDDSGRLLMDEIRTALGEMDVTEQALLRERESALTHASIALVNTLLLGMVCSVLMSFVVGLMLIRRMTHLTKVFASKIDQLDAELAREGAQQMQLTEQAEAKRDAAAQEAARVLATSEHLAKKARELLEQVQRINNQVEQLRETRTNGPEELSVTALHAVQGALSLDLGTVDLCRLLTRVQELDTELAHILRESASVQDATERSRTLVASLLFQLGSSPRAYGARTSGVRSSSLRDRARASTSTTVRPRRGAGAVTPSSKPEFKQPSVR